MYFDFSFHESGVLDNQEKTHFRSHALPGIFGRDNRLHFNDSHATLTESSRFKNKVSENDSSRSSDSEKTQLRQTVLFSSSSSACTNSILVFATATDGKSIAVGYDAQIQLKELAKEELQ